MESEVRSGEREEAPGAKTRSPLEALSFLATRAGALTVASEASLLAARVEEGLFYVACVGQFKRGKSTLINALVGESVLPAGVVPVTSVVTVMRHGAVRAARVRFESGHWQEIDPSDLAGYVSEAQNPENRKGVLAAEVFLPHSLLSSGLCLVDTPGLGSVFEANTAATHSFIPHIDAALVVLGADPPISGEELALVGEVSKTVRRFLFVLNKSDRLTPEERREARLFAEQLLTRKLGRSPGPILEVSATESLTSGKPTRDLPALHESLRRLAHEAGADMIEEAKSRGIRRLSARVVKEIEERRQALLLPIEESERRIEALRKSVAHAERAMGDLGYLFTAEQERLSVEFGKARDEFLARALPMTKEKLVGAIARFAKSGAALRRRAPSLAREIAHEALEAWLPEVEPLAEEMYRKAMRRFVELANDFFQRLASSDEMFRSAPPRDLETDTGFRTQRRFFFIELFELAPRAGLSIGGPAAIGRDAAGYLRQLLEHNSTRVVNDLDERVRESRRRLESEIRERLREGLESAVSALENARARRSAGAEAVAAEIARLDDLRRQVEALQPEATQTE
jgi:GTPase SAR1 family protein/polyhydroxyalkanoate synthesis regulator phasin